MAIRPMNTKQTNVNLGEIERKLFFQLAKNAKLTRTALLRRLIFMEAEREGLPFNRRANDKKENHTK